jgi:RNA polymerase sigma-70 factor (ECF subfamily)
MTLVDEKELIDECLRNNRIAQKELFEKYYAAMYTKALRIVGNDDSAYDAVQNAFILVFNNLHQFRYKSTLGAWISKILIREALRIVKKELPKLNIEDLNYSEPITWPEQLNGEYLHKAIMKLPVGYRAVFTLIEIEGFSHKEVSQKLNITEGTSKSQLYHAKKRLQTELKELIELFAKPKKTTQYN